MKAGLPKNRGDWAVEPFERFLQMRAALRDAGLAMESATIHAEEFARAGLSLADALAALNGIIGLPDDGGATSQSDSPSPALGSESESISPSASESPSPTGTGSDSLSESASPSGPVPYDKMFDPPFPSAKLEARVLRRRVAELEAALAMAKGEALLEDEPEVDRLITLEDQAAKKTGGR